MSVHSPMTDADGRERQTRWVLIVAMSNPSQLPPSRAPRWTDENLPLAARRKLLAEELRRVRARAQQDAQAVALGHKPSSSTREPRRGD